MTAQPIAFNHGSRREHLELGQISTFVPPRNNWDVRSKSSLSMSRAKFKLALRRQLQGGNHFLGQQAKAALAASTIGTSETATVFCANKNKHAPFAVGGDSSSGRSRPITF